VDFADFSGGFNDTVQAVSLADNEWADFLNMDALPGGGCRVRGGCKAVNNAAFPDGVTQMVEWNLKDGSTKTIVVAGRLVYEFSSVTGEQSIVSGSSGEALVLSRDTFSYTFFKDEMYFTDGVTFWKWSDKIYNLHTLDSGTGLSFKAGDIIRLTATKDDSVFRGDEDVNICDVRNVMPGSYTYPYRLNNADGLNTKTVKNIKKKFVNFPAGGTEDLVGSKDYNVPGGIYALKCRNFSWSYVNGSNFVTTPPCGVAFHRGMGSTHAEGWPEYPFTGPVSVGADTKLSNLPDLEVTLEYKQSYCYCYAVTDFEQYGVLNDCYKFTADVNNFYPHNWNWIKGESSISIGSNAVTGPVSEGDMSIRVNKVAGIPDYILKCKYFVYNPKAFRFFASGNPDNPTSIYYSNFNAFENIEEDGVFNWSEVNVLYPRFNFGALTGLYYVGDSILVCYEKGFCSVGGSEPDEFVFRNFDLPVGVSGNGTFSFTPNGAIFYSVGKLWYFSLTLLDNNYVKVAGQNEFLEISRNKCGNILKGSSGHIGVYRDGRYYLYFVSASGDARILVYDIYDGHFNLYGGFNILCFLAKFDGRLFAGDGGGYILDCFDYAYLNDFDKFNPGGKTVEFRLKSKLFDFSAFIKTNVLNNFYLNCNAFNSEILNKFRIRCYSDFDLHGIDITLNDNGVSFKSGVDVWRDNRFSPELAHWYKVNCSLRFNHIYFEISNVYEIAGGEEDDRVVAGSNEIFIYRLGLEYCDAGAADEFSNLVMGRINDTRN
jgi:hypothetical protein